MKTSSCQYHIGTYYTRLTANPIEYIVSKYFFHCRVGYFLKVGFQNICFATISTIDKRKNRRKLFETKSKRHR